MKLTKKNFTIHNIIRFLTAYKRKIQIYLFSRNGYIKKFVEHTALAEYLESPLHIREQFIFRIESMKLSEQGRECLLKQECICGCAVPDLQLSNDTCEGGCYPIMMDQKEWNTYKLNHGFQIDLDRELMYKYITKS